MAREMRKTVTVFFSDVVGSTTLGEQLDPEALRLVMSRWFALAETALERHGGTVEKFIGDAVMAVFGVPVVHEDDALRAVRAASELQASLRELNRELELAPGIQLAVRTGITTGEVVTGGVDATDQRIVTGDVVNTAKRLEEAAGANQILIGAVTAGLVRGAATLDPCDPVAARGKALPVEAWRVLAVDGTAEGVPRRLDGRLVGRRPPLQRLLAAVEDAGAERRCRPVFVLGPPGIGKSRLARELGDVLGDRATVLSGRCIPYGRGVTFWALREILGAAGGIEALPLDPADAATVRERLEVAVGASEARASVARDEIFWAVRRAVEALARDRPLVLCLDDLHLAEPMLLDLLEYLVGWSRDAPVLILGLSRPELLEVRPPATGTEVIALEPLTDAETGELLGDLGVDEPGLRRQIGAIADGNPLFVEQLAAMVREAPPSPAGIDVPASITAVLDARLDRLTRDERSALERAAVAGREFWQGAVVDLSPAGERAGVGAALLALVRRDLVEPVPSSALPFDDVFRFRHALIRDAAYGGLPKTERAELHQRFAARLDSAPVGTADAPDEIIGYHLELAWRYRTELGIVDADTAALGETAGRRLGAAARGAFSRADLLGASFLLQRAIPLLPEGDHERLALERELAQSLWELGETERALETSEALLAEAEAAGDVGIAAHARLSLLHAQFLSDDLDSHRGAVLEVIAVFEEAGDTLGLTRAWRRISWLERRAGRHGAAERAARRALDHAIAIPDRREEARAVDELCTSLLYGPTPVEEALEQCERLLDRSDTAPTLEANVLSSVAGLEAMAGRLVEARAAYERAKLLFEEFGLRLSLGGLTQVGVPLELLAGDLEAAQREAELGLEILAAVGGAAVQAPLLAEVHLAAGRTEAAAEALAVVDPSRTPHLISWQVKWLSARARIGARRGEDTVALAQEAVALAEQGDDPNLTGDALLALAETQLLAGDGDGADASVAAARGHFERKGNVIAAEAARV